MNKMTRPKIHLPTRQQVLSFLNGLAEKGLVLLVVVYIAFSVGRSVLKNYQMNRRIEALKEQIAILEREQDYLKTLIAYYRTNTFKELKAREELGFQKPGEFVLSVPVDPEDRPLSERSDILAAQPPSDRARPNYVKWYDYFFKG